MQKKSELIDAVFTAVVIIALGVMLWLAVSREGNQEEGELLDYPNKETTIEDMIYEEILP
jgi:hypothetical protein